jgi:disulfide bond formation protein DsbB
MEKLPLDRSRWPFIALLASAAMLATAHAVEIFLHFAPCQMCYWQRYVFWGAGLVALLTIGLNWRGAERGLKRAMCILLGLIFLGGAVIAIWHSLIEWKILPPLSGCVASHNISPTDNLWDRLSQPIAVASCDKAPFYIIGLSMAGWNAVASLVLAGLSFFSSTRGARTDTNNEPVQLEEAA